MNRFEGGGNRLAVIEYLDGDFRIVQTGSHVVCAITGKTIPLDELRYWSVARQEAYVDAAASLEAERKAGSLPALAGNVVLKRLRVLSGFLGRSCRGG